MTLTQNYRHSVTVIVSVVLVAFAVFMISHMNDTYATIAFSAEFGTIGQTNEKLADPTDIILNRHGSTILVVHGGDDKISKFYYTSPNDYKIATPNSAFTENNRHIANPSSIERIEKDYFVLDGTNVHVFDDDGSYTTTFAGNKIKTPTDIAVHAPLKLAFVSDTSGDKIHVFHTNGTYKYDVNKLTNHDSMSDPGGVAVDPSSDYLYVSDSKKNRIAVFKLLDDRRLCPVQTAQVKPGVCFVHAFGTSGGDNAQFTNPTKLTVDIIPNGRGDLYVSDTNNDRIQIFRFTDSGGSSCPDGTKNVTTVSNIANANVCFVGQIGTSGNGDEQFKKPTGIAIDSKKRLLYVADTGNDRIQVITLDAQADDSSDSSSNTSTTIQSATKPNSPRGVTAIPTSPESILVQWTEPIPRGDPPIQIIGYKIDVREKITGQNTQSDFQTIVTRTSTNATSIHHTNLEPNKTYTYRVHAIGPGGDTAATSLSSETTSATPTKSNKPIIIQGVALSPKQIKITWLPPSDTLGQSIASYTIKKIFSANNNIDVGVVSGSKTSFVYPVSPSETKVELAVVATFAFGSSPLSDTITINVDSDSSHSGIIETPDVPNTKLTAPTPPTRVQAESVSDTRIDISWRAPTSDGNTPITGYTIEAKKDGTSDFIVLARDISSTRYQHNVDAGSAYTYRIYATNAIGESLTSHESSATARSVGIKLSPINSIVVDVGKLATFTAKISSDSSSFITFRLSDNAPSDARISNTGVFRWTPSSDHGGDSFVFDVIVTQGQHTDTESVRIRVNTVVVIPETPQTSQPASQTSPEQSSDSASQLNSEPKLAEFVEDDVDPQTYIDRYNNEPQFKEWFDEHYLDRFDSIYDAVGVLEIPAEFVDASHEPQYYIDRYNNEPQFKEWFDEHYSEYESIHHAVGLQVEIIKDEEDLVRPLPRLDVPLAPFVDESEDPMTYVNRYNTDDSFKEWFDEHYALEYNTIYRAVGLLDVPAPFVDESEDPMTYVNRYNTDDSFKEWFDEYYSEYLSIYHAVGLPDPLLFNGSNVIDEMPVIQYGICGPGTMLIEGICTIIIDDDDGNNDDGT